MSYRKRKRAVTFRITAPEHLMKIETSMNGKLVFPIFGVKFEVKVFRTKVDTVFHATSQEVDLSLINKLKLSGFEPV